MPISEQDTVWSRRACHRAKLCFHRFLVPAGSRDSNPNKTKTVCSLAFSRPNSRLISIVLPFETISLRLLALILCSNCSNTFNKVFEGIALFLLNYFLRLRRFPCACTKSSMHGLSISRTALTVQPPHHPPKKFNPTFPPAFQSLIVDF